MAFEDKKLEILLAAKDSTKRAFDTVQGRIKGFTSNLFSLKGALSVVGGAAALGGIGYFIKQNLELADAIGKTADKLGIGTAALQEYRFAASQSGVAQNTLDMALQRFTRRVGEAAQGKGELKDTLIQYNIAVRDAEGRTRSVDAVLSDLADTIQGAESNQERLRIAFKAFDSEGAALINMLSEGSAGLNKLRQEARDLGIVLDEDLIRNSERANDRLNAFANILKIQVASAVTSLAPQIASLAMSFTEAAQGLGMFLDKSEVAKLTKLRTEIVAELDEIDEKLSAKGGVTFEEGFLANWFGDPAQQKEAIERRKNELLSELMRVSKEIQDLTTKKPTTAAPTSGLDLFVMPEGLKEKLAADLDYINTGLAAFQFQSEQAWRAYQEGAAGGIDTNVALYEGIEASRMALANLQMEVEEGVSQSFESLKNNSREVGGFITGTVGGAFTDILIGVRDAKEAAKDLFKTLVSKAVSSLVQIGIQQVVLAAIQKGTIASTTAATVAGMTAITAAATPAAITTSIATAGVSAATGAASFSISMATMSAVAMAMISAFANLFTTKAAKGGIFDRPTLTLFGEEGTEAVVPLAPHRRREAQNILAQILPIIGGRTGGALTGEVNVYVEFSGPVRLDADMEEIKTNLGLAVKDALVGAF